MTREPKKIGFDELSDWLGITPRAVQKSVKNGDPMFPSNCYGYEKYGRTNKVFFNINNLYRQAIGALADNDLYFDRQTSQLLDKGHNTINPKSLDTAYQRYYLLARHINKDYSTYITDTGRRSWSGKPASKELIDDILERFAGGLSITQIAKELGRDKSTISRTLKKYEEKGLGMKYDNALHNRGRKKKEVDKEVYDFLIKERTITDNVSDIITQAKRKFKGKHTLSGHIIRRTVREIEGTGGDLRNLQKHNFKRAKNINRTYLPRSYRDLQPNQEWYMDFHYINPVKVLDEETGEIGNIRTMAIIDGRTRRMIGYKHTMSTPNPTEVAYMVIDTAYKHGWPGSILSDAGPENYQSMKGLETFLRGMNNVGIKMTKSLFQGKSARNGNKRSGGHYTSESEMPRQNLIERWFLTMKGRFEKRLKGYDMSAKGRYPKDTPRLTRVEFEGHFDQFIHDYNTEMEHSELGRPPEAEYHIARKAGFEPLWPREEDRNTYIMHFMHRQKVTRRAGFGTLLVRVKSPFSGEYIHFDLQQIDPTVGTIYVAIAPDEKQAAIYDENDNYLFVAPSAVSYAGSDDTSAIDLFNERLKTQQSRVKPIKKVIKEAEKTDTLYPKPVPVSQAEKQEQKVSKLIPSNFKAQDDPEPTVRPKTDKKKLDKIFKQFQNG